MKRLSHFFEALKMLIFLIFNANLAPGTKVELLRKTSGLHHFWLQNPKIYTKSHRQVAPFRPKMIFLVMRLC